MQTLGPYQLLERIGQGGMGEIYLAVLRRPGAFEKHVALKRILPAVAGDPEFLRMFHREARVAALLNHQNIVQVYDYGAEGDSAYMAMELVDGADLGTLLARLGPPELACSLAILAGVAGALDYAHRRTDREGRPMNIVHRDVSPGNVLLSREGEVKLTDFGLVTGLPDEHRSEAGVLKGKYAYVAPEQAAGAAVDPRADLFSFGVMAYELLAGRRPFVGTLLETLMAMRDGRYEPLGAEQAPDALRELVHQCLASRREDRPADAAGLLARLGEIPRPADAAMRLAAWVQSGIGERARLPATPERTEVGPEPFRDVGELVTEATPAPDRLARIDLEPAPAPPPPREPSQLPAGPSRPRRMRPAIALAVLTGAALAIWLVSLAGRGSDEGAGRATGSPGPSTASATDAAIQVPDVPLESEAAVVASPADLPSAERDAGETSTPDAVDTVNIGASPEVDDATAAAAPLDPPDEPVRPATTWEARWQSRDLDLRGAGEPVLVGSEGVSLPVDFSHPGGDYTGSVSARLVPTGRRYRLELSVYSRPWSAFEVAGRRAESPDVLVVEGIRPGRTALRLWPMGEGTGFVLELSIETVTD